ncbi:MAG: hypothetical protein M3305_03955 [Actinomycetota bacterium]|jgi:hypothetical protein|nr:hypothetical protein [Actinomycetota bacterium]
MRTSDSLDYTSVAVEVHYLGRFMLDGEDETVPLRSNHPGATCGLPSLHALASLVARFTEEEAPVLIGGRVLHGACLLSALSVLIFSYL